MKLERDIEKACMREVRRRDGEYRKLDVGYGAKGWLDQAVWLPGGVHFIAEFKRPGERPTPLQARRIKRFRYMGYDVGVFDSVEGFVSFMDSRTASSAAPKSS